MADFHRRELPGERRRPRAVRERAIPPATSGYALEAVKISEEPAVRPTPVMGLRIETRHPGYGRGDVLRPGLQVRPLPFARTMISSPTTSWATARPMWRFSRAGMRPGSAAGRRPRRHREAWLMRQAVYSTDSTPDGDGQVEQVITMPGAEMTGRERLPRRYDMKSLTRTDLARYGHGCRRYTGAYPERVRDEYSISISCISWGLPRPTMSSATRVVTAGCRGERGTRVGILTVERTSARPAESLGPHQDTALRPRIGVSPNPIRPITGSKRRPADLPYILHEITTDFRSYHDVQEIIGRASA